MADPKRAAKSGILSHKEVACCVQTHPFFRSHESFSDHINNGYEFDLACCRTIPFLALYFIGHTHPFIHEYF